MLALRRTLVTALIAVTASVCAQASRRVARRKAPPRRRSNYRTRPASGRRSDQYKGKWVVLYFYPKDFTGGCTTQACELRDNIFAFQKADAVILGVSVDDVDSHEEIRRGTQPAVRHPRRPDQGGVQEVRRVDQPTALLELASRQTFLIGPDGKIVKHWDEGGSEGPLGHGAGRDQAPIQRTRRRPKLADPEGPALTWRRAFCLSGSRLTAATGAAR